MERVHQRMKQNEQDEEGSGLRARRLGINTSQEAVVYMRQDCHVCRSEGFTAHRRVEVRLGKKTVIATLNIITGDLLELGEAGLSESAWQRLGASEGAALRIDHPAPLTSMGLVRSKIYGNRLGQRDFDAIVSDVVGGQYSDIQLSAFVSACAGARLDRGEMVALTRSMVAVGDRLDWGRTPIVDKHSVGGLPGNRTTPIVVAIVAAHGLIMPKTSSRAITSPAGTADTMACLAPVDLDTATIRRVVETEGACIAWGGAVRLSPADEVLIRIERAMDIDSEGQLVASVLSKKIAAGSTHVVLDIPVGPTAKVRNLLAAQALSDDLVEVAAELGLIAHAIVSDGAQPVGRGIGPALEARDVLAVLRREADAPKDLADRAVALAGAIFEMANSVASGTGVSLAAEILADGRAWTKFEAICIAQGGLREPQQAAYKCDIAAVRAGRVVRFDNRRLAKVAKLAGAPTAPTAGIDMHVRLGTAVEKGQSFYTIHAESPGELSYAAEFAAANADIVELEVLP